MHAKLFCKTGQLAGANYTISDEATIGKGPENTIQLYPSLVSTRHARIFFDKKANAFFIEDLRSRNGTKVDGMKVVTKEKLNKLHVITFAGQCDFIFQVSAGDAKAATPASPMKAQPVAQSIPKSSPTKGVVSDQKTVIDAGFGMMPKLGETPKPVDSPNKTVIGDDFLPMPKISPEAPIKAQPLPTPRATPANVGNKTVIGDDFLPMPGMPTTQAKSPVSTPTVEEGKPAQAIECRVEFNDLPGGPRTFKLKEGENTVGRERGCDITIDDGSLSRKHASLVVRSGIVLIKDLGSKNHTFLENQKVNYEMEIRGGVNLMFGMVNAILVKK